jgi:uncharacterized protein (DUF849 family)
MPRPIYRLMLSDGFTFGFPPRDWALEAYARLRDEIAPGTPWMIAGLAVDVMPVAASAIERGYHLRVGLEDAPLGTDRSNPELVAAAARLIREAGCEPATAAEVRAALAAGA